MSTIRFARLSFERKLSHYNDQRSAIERRKEALLEVIDWSTNVNELLKDTDMSEKREKGQWYFGDVQEGEDYIAARLGKESEKTSRRPDEEVKGFVPVERDDTVVSFFVIDLSTSVMAYEFRRDIGRKAPFRILRAVFNSYYEGEEELSVSPLVDKEEVREELDKLHKITRVRFAGLTPPNPDSTDSSRSMHDFLRDTGIDRLLLDGHNESDEDEGINLDGDPILDGGLNLAEEGYGSATVEGEDEEGEEVSVSTDEKPIESEVDIEEDDDEENRDNLLDEIRDALDRLEG